MQNLFDKERSAKLKTIALILVDIVEDFEAGALARMEGKPLDPDRFKKYPEQILRAIDQVEMDFQEKWHELHIANHEEYPPENS